MKNALNISDKLYRRRHSAAHLMAWAVMNLFDDVKFDIGPPTEEGFYYDFDMEHRLTPEDLEKIEAEMQRLALQVNTTLENLFGKAGIKLVDFKLEFGRVLPGRTDIVLADEISPDTCRLWDAETHEKMDKDRFRRDLGDMMSYYAEVLQRLESVSAPS